MLINANNLYFFCFTSIQQMKFEIALFFYIAEKVIRGVVTFHSVCIITLRCEYFPPKTKYVTVICKNISQLGRLWTSNWKARNNMRQSHAHFHWPDNHITRNTSIHKEKIKMINLVIRESSCIIELFVQSHNSSNTVFLEVRYVGFWSMKRISWSTKTSCQPKTGSQQWTNKINETGCKINSDRCN